MRIERGRFLFLTSAIFAACATRSEPSTPGAIIIPPQPPSPPAPFPTATPERMDAGTTKEEPPAVAVATDDEDESPYDADPTVASIPLAKSIHAQSCDVADNAKGKPVSCALKAPGPTCESFTDTKSECAKLTRWVVPKAAEKAVACLNAKSGKKDICLFNVGVACVIESLSSVCLDAAPKIQTSCERVMAKCKKVDREARHMTLDACKAAMSAIVPARQSRFLTCAAESCSLVPCIYAAEP